MRLECTGLCNLAQPSRRIHADKASVQRDRRQIQMNAVQHRFKPGARCQRDAAHGGWINVD
jgi:hypothetical protein